MGKFGNKVIKFIKNNDTNILTGIGIADGLGLGAYLWYRTGQKVQNKINNKQNEENRKLSMKEKVKETWKIFILPVANTAISGGLLIYSAKVGNKRLAALASAYNLTEVALQQYMEKTKELVGDKKAEAITQKVAEENFNNDNSQPITVVKDGIVLQEPATRIKFTTTWDKVDLAIERTQKAAMLGNGEVSLSYFIRELGLEPSEATDMLGWDINQNGDIRISKVSILDKDGIPCGSLDYHGDLIAL